MGYLCRECPLIIKVYLWYYRLLQTTFGGLRINSNGQLFTNIYLKYYGYFALILIITSEIYTGYLLYQTNIMKTI